MKCLKNDSGRECTKCRKFKAWDEFGNHKKGVNGRNSDCIECHRIDSLNRSRDNRMIDELINGIKPIKHKKGQRPEEIMERLNNKKHKDMSKEYKTFFSKITHCIQCETWKIKESFEVLSKPKKHHNGRRKSCNNCFKDMTWCSEHKQEKIKSRCGNGSYSYRCSKCKGKHKKVSKANKAKEAIKLAGGECNTGNGFIYLYRCDELNCFKIGCTKDDPREYIVEKSRDYGLKLNLVAFIVSPVRKYDAERVATCDIKHKRVQHTKPCGGEAVELFNCGMYEAINILRPISSHIYIEPNPFIDMDQLGSVEMIDVIAELDKRDKANKYIPSDKVIFNKVLRGVKKEKRWCIKDRDGVNKSGCCCQQILDKKYINECKNAKLIDNIKLSKSLKVT